MRYTVRRVLPSEYPKYRIHLKSLDDNSKYLRFGSVTCDQVIDKLCDDFELNHDKHILFCVEDCSLDFVAVGHIAIDGTMELAFSVHKSYQGHGLGSALMCRCIQYCRVNNILKGCMVCLSHNAVIKHLCIKHGIHIHTESGETQAEIELDRAGIDTYVQESIDGNISAFDYMCKRSLISWAYA